MPDPNTSSSPPLNPQTLKRAWWSTPLAMTCVLFALFSIPPLLAGQPPTIYPIAIALFLGVCGMGWGAQSAASAIKVVGKAFDVTYLDTAHPLAQRVARLSTRLDLAPPTVGIMPHNNAFAVGADTSRAAVIVGKPLIDKLKDDELDAVIGHELGHIATDDMRRMQFAEGYQRMFTVLLSVFMTVLINALTRTRLGRFAGHAFARLARVTFFCGTELIVKGTSRRREFYADAIGANLTSADAMARALKTLHGAAPSAPEREYACLMFHGVDGFPGFATHPSLDRRLAALKDRTYVDNLAGINKPNPAAEFLAQLSAKAAKMAASQRTRTSTQHGCGFTHVEKRDQSSETLANRVPLRLRAPTETKRIVSSSSTAISSRCRAWIHNTQTGLQTGHLRAAAAVGVLCLSLFGVGYGLGAFEPLSTVQKPHQTAQTKTLDQLVPLAATNTPTNDQATKSPVAQATKSALALKPTQKPLRNFAWTGEVNVAALNLDVLPTMIREDSVSDLRVLNAPSAAASSTAPATAHITIPLPVRRPTHFKPVRSKPVRRVDPQRLARLYSIAPLAGQLAPYFDDHDARKLQSQIQVFLGGTGPSAPRRLPIRTQAVQTVDVRVHHATPNCAHYNLIAKMGSKTVDSGTMKACRPTDGNIWRLAYD